MGNREKGLVLILLRGWGSLWDLFDLGKGNGLLTSLVLLVVDFVYRRWGEGLGVLSGSVDSDAWIRFSNLSKDLIAALYWDAIVSFKFSKSISLAGELGSNISTWGQSTLLWDLTLEESAQEGRLFAPLSEIN